MPKKGSGYVNPKRSIEETKRMAGPLWNWLWDLTYKEAIKIDPGFNGTKKGTKNKEYFDYGMEGDYEW